MDLTKAMRKSNSFIFDFLIAAIADKASNKDMAKMKEEPREIIMTWNGVEIDVKQALDMLERNFNYGIKKRVDEEVQIIKEELMEPLEEKIVEISELIEKKLKDEKWKTK